MKKFLCFLIVLIITIFVFKINNQVIPEIQSWPIPQIPESPHPPQISPKPEPGSKVEWLNFPIQQDKKTDMPFLTDIISHLPSEFGNQYYDKDRVTWGHESTHGINSYIRNTFAPKGGAGFYVGNNKAIVMTQPKMTLRQIAGIIPQNLRGGRYQLYFVKQTGDWNFFPLYCFDEWISYNNGAAVGLEITEIRGNSDVMIGALEFSIYAMLTCVAIDKYDPQYLETNTQFKEFVAYELKRSIGIYKKGIQMPQYRRETKLEENVKQNAECIAILKKMYDDGLTMQILFDK